LFINNKESNIEKQLSKLGQETYIDPPSIAIQDLNIDRLIINYESID